MVGEESCGMNCPGVDCQNKMYQNECVLPYQIVIWDIGDA